MSILKECTQYEGGITNLNIYTDVTKELRRSEFEGLDSYFKNEYNKAANI